nr:unnamed protein product [Callosobruchus analis]
MFTTSGFLFYCTITCVKKFARFTFYIDSSIDASVASINKPKSISVSDALAVRRSKNVSSGDRFSFDGKAVKPATKGNPFLYSLQAKYDFLSKITDWLQRQLT